MASIFAATPTSSITCAGALLHKKPSVGVSSSPVLGLPKMGKEGRVRGGMGKKESKDESGVGSMSGSMMAAAAVAMASTSPAAMALVDERMSTEGTGLPFGLSNNLLVWILLGVFALIWSLYSVYTSSLDEDEESGLSL